MIFVRLCLACLVLAGVLLSNTVFAQGGFYPCDNLTILNETGEPPEILLRKTPTSEPTHRLARYPDGTHSVFTVATVVGSQDGKFLLSAIRTLLGTEQIEAKLSSERWIEPSGFIVALRRKAALYAGPGTNFARGLVQDSDNGKFIDRTLFARGCRGPWLQVWNEKLGTWWTKDVCNNEIEPCEGIQRYWNEPDDRWNQYVNPKFGLAIDIPEGHFTSPEVAPAGDGVTYNHGALTLNVWGSFNVLSSSPYQHLCPSPCKGETYRVNTSAMGVTSGYDSDNNVYYGKCIRATSGSATVFRCFRMTYPRGTESIFNDVVERMSKSLR